MSSKLSIALIALFFLLGIWTGKKIYQPAETTVIEEVEEKIEKPVAAQTEETIPQQQKPTPTSHALATAQNHEEPVRETPEEQAPVASVKPKSWISSERPIARVTNAQDVAKILENTKINSLMTELQSVQPITQMDETLEFMNGSFTGTMTSQSAVRGFEMAMEANLRINNQQLRGRLNVRLSRNGRAFSRNNNNGHVQNVQKFQNGSSAVLVSSGEFHFQLYYFPGLESLEGNCYQQTKPGTLEYVGTVHLEKI